MPKSCWTSLLTALVIMVPIEAGAVELIQLGQVEALGTYTSIKDSEDDYGADTSAFYSPVLKFNDTFCLIPLVDVHFNSYPQYLPQEEGNSFYNTYLVTNLHIAARKEYKPGWFIKLTPLATWNIMKETPDDDWGDGLYDYTDYGVEAELRHIISGASSEQHYSSAFEYYKRTYPNFTTLISSTTVTPPEVHEKDYHGLKYSARAERNYTNLGGWYFEPYLLQKLYSDKHTVNDDGTLDLNEDRHDYEVGLNFGGTYLPRNLSRFQLSLDNDYVINNSNMSYYDTRNTLGLGDDVFTDKYYDYQSFSIAPGVEYAHPIGNEKSIRLRLGYDYTVRWYSDRKAQFSNGDYRSQDQHDQEHTYSAILRIPLIKSVDFVVNYALNHVDSNQKFEDFYRYSFDSYSIKTGISWRF